ncbi:MAG: hypothetical protein KBB39_02460 [Phycicoccus sp.]|nr:hypothetical protein [Phycicoccus sp.]
MTWELVVPSGRLAVLWLLVAFVLTTIATRAVTRHIRAKEGEPAAAQTEPGGAGLIKNVHIGGVHVHHQVWGILLCLLTGLLLVTYHPQPGWGLNALAVAFGVGAALALDEFAMWLHLEDVYWSAEGRKSITALMTAGAIALVLVLGADPLDLGSEDNAGIPAWGVAAFALINLGFALICILKGKNLVALIAVFMPFVGLVGAIRLAKPGSWWARRRYQPGSRKERRAARRFDQAYHDRWRKLHDAIGGEPTVIDPEGADRPG